MYDVTCLTACQYCMAVSQDVFETAALLKEFPKICSLSISTFCCIMPGQKYLMHINYSLLKWPALEKALSVSLFHIKPLNCSKS